MSAQLQLQIPDNAQWTVIGGTTDASGNATVAAPVGYKKIFAMRVQVPSAATLGLSGYVQFQYVQNSVDRLPSNTDPFSVPVTDDTEVALYTQPNPALNLQFNLYDLRLAGTLKVTTPFRLYVLHTLN